MEQTTELPQAMDEDQYLDYTQQVRQKVVQELTKENKLPDDPKMANVLLSTLDGMDRNALGRKRIKVDQETNQAVDGMSGLVAQMLRQSRLPEFFQATQDPDAPQRAAPRVEGDLPDGDIVEGELSQHPIQISIDDFQSRFAKPTEPEAAPTT